MQRKRAEDEQAYRRKQEEFIDRICHEIRNPIQGIVGNCDIMSEALTNVMNMMMNADNQNLIMIKNCIDAIRTCGEYQRVVTDDVLMLSKLELGKIQLNQAPMSPAQAIHKVASMFEAQASTKKLSLQKDLTRMPDDVVVICDSGHVIMVMINLITNAIKFTSRGGVILCVSMNELFATPNQEYSHELVFSVRDTGRGMDGAELAVIFDRFSQATQRIYSEYGGSGLGLFICRMVVGLMGGKITVDSKKDVGSTFTFTVKCNMVSAQERLKFLSEQAAASAAATAAIPMSNASNNAVSTINTAAPLEGTLRVLVVEDNRINQMVVVRMLKKCGCDCVTADDGVEAWEYFQNNGKFDLIVMDMAMPRMDGYECTRLIRALEKKENKDRTLVVGLSGNVRQEHHDMGKEVEMDKFINKPITQKDIASLIKDVRNNQVKW
ncbi:hybrid signal transduction histidine kinase dhkK [Acrasis kona]